MITNTPRVLIRADASHEIGLGHVKRCLSLAVALQDIGAEVRLISRDLGVDIAGLGGGADIGIVHLPSASWRSAASAGVPHADWARVPWGVDVDDTIRAAKGESIDWVIVDHYAFDSRWHRAVSSALGARIAVIDDLADRILDADVLVDQNYTADHRDKYAGLLSPKSRIFGGPRFALLSKEYANARRYEIRDTVNSIGIFMGGIDAPNWTSTVLRACRDNAAFPGPVEIVTTTDNPNYKELLELAAKYPSTRVRVNLSSLAEFFATHDLQIGAGGGATWERCCIGAPTLAIVCADNQRSVIADLARIGAVATAEVSEGQATPTIGLAISGLIHESNSRRQVSLAARRMVDGLGSSRVAHALFADRMELRPASTHDASLIFGWRNHPEVREVSGNSTELEWPQHLAWMQRVLDDTDRILAIGTIGPRPVGVIRFDGISGKSAEVSLYLNPALRGLGLGAELLRLGENQVRKLGLEAVVATVIDGNDVSRRLFQAAGYAPRGVRTLVKKLTA